MKDIKILDSFKKQFAKSKVVLRKHSPTILIFGGIVLGVASTVTACIATTKLKPVVDYTKKKVETVKAFKEETPSYTDKNEKRDLLAVYVKGGFEIAKLYFVPISLSALSIASILVGQKILKERHLVLLAAYSTLGKEFKDYRERVKAKYGEDEEKFIFMNRVEEILESDKKDADDKEKDASTDKKPSWIATSQYSQYARIFDETNPFWEKNWEYNRSMLHIYESQFNQNLQADGYLFLNTVYKALGFPPTKEGQIVGWLYRPNDRNYHGDNYVDFGIIDISKPKAVDFVNGYERSIVLDFNIDGPIIDLI